MLHGTSRATVVAEETASATVELHSSFGSLAVGLTGISDFTGTNLTVELTDSKGITQSKTSSGDAVEFERLIPDTYTISVKGTDDTGTEVLHGSSSITVVAEETVSATVELKSSLGILIVDFAGDGSDSVVNYIVKLSGSNEFEKTEEVTDRSVQFNDLVPDTYNIVVKGINENGVEVLYGSSSVTVVAKDTVSATVELLKVVSDFAGLQAAVTAGGTVYVVNDITVTGKLTISNDVEIRALDKDVTLRHTGDGSLFIVQNSANLRIGGGEYMLTLDGNGNEKTRSTALVQINSGTVDLYGTITNGVNNDSAAGIKVNGSSSTLNMYDGAIVSNCRCSNTWGIGGAIGLESGTMNMYGGSITGNSAQDASAVYVNNNSVFTMSGGTISGNSNDIAINISSSTFKIGGGALISSDDKVSLKNIPVAITIISPLTGGNSVATLTLKDGFSSGTAVLTAGDGVILANEVGKFALSSGTIKSDGTLQ